MVRIVQLVDKDGENIYPIGSDPNKNPTWLTMTQEGVYTSTTTNEFMAPNGEKFYLITPVSTTTNPATTYLKSSDYDLSNITSYKQTLIVDVKNTNNNIVGLYDVTSGYQYTRYMGSYLSATAKTPYESSQTGRASSLSGYYWYNDAIALNTSTSNLSYTVIVEATANYIGEGKWMIDGFYSVNGFLTAGQFNMYITAPVGHLPLFTLPSIEVAQINSIKRTVSLLLE